MTEILGYEFETEEEFDNDMTEHDYRDINEYEFTEDGEIFN